MGNQEDYITLVKERTNLKEGKSFVERFLVTLYLNGNMATKALARAIGLPIPVTTAMKKEFIAFNVVEQDKGVVLTPCGVDYVEQVCGYGGLNLELYKKLLADEAFQNEFVLSLAEKYAAVFEGRPEVDVTIDQAKGTPETAFKRAMLCLREHCLLGKKILCVGDDDLVSIAIGLLAKELFADNPIRTFVTVFDIDTRFIAYINAVAQEYSLPVECVSVDLKDSLPLSYANSFDCFFTDPPYTSDGMSLFLSRGITALKKENGLTVFLSYGMKPVGEMFEVEKIILSHGLVIKSIDKGFNQYEGGSLLGNVSQMMMLESTGDVSPVITGDYAGSIYTREFKTPNSVYVCKQCRQKLELGPDKAYVTIEQLKREGCPHCGNKTFDLQKKPAPHISLDRSKSLGIHIIVDFFACNADVLSDVEAIKDHMHEAAVIAKASIVSEEFHEFDPYGVSGVVIIQESHFTIHTWPEYDYAAVDLFTCGDSLELWNAFEYLKEAFGSRNMEYTDVARGMLRNGKVFPKKPEVK